MKDLLIHESEGYRKRWLSLGLDYVDMKGHFGALEISDADGCVPGYHPKQLLTWTGMTTLLQVLRGECESCECEGVTLAHVAERSTYRISTDFEHALEFDTRAALVISLVLEKLIVSNALDIDID